MILKGWDCILFVKPSIKELQNALFDHYQSCRAKDVPLQIGINPSQSGGVKRWPRRVSIPSCDFNGVAALTLTGSHQWTTYSITTCTESSVSYKDTCTKRAL